MSAPVSLGSRAAENLRFIRETMQRASRFTAVPGRGGIAMGVTGLVAGLISARQPTQSGALAIWLAESVVAFTIGLVTVRLKARVTGEDLWSGPARKFALAFAPPILAGCAITFALWRAGVFSVIPGVWLALYGVAVLGAGAFSVAVVPAMGIGFLLLGCVALLLPGFGNLALTCGFGLLHIVFGAIIARRYGG